ncbi:MAG: DUF4364 family protein [Clostridia bacterium]|nr:DUF4364 family protein [Clostridia bacterium]
MDFQDSFTSKLILLFVMEKMEMPLTETTIIDICTNQNDWINYMECKDVLFKLLEANLIYCTKSDDSEDSYRISIEGQNCLEHFYQKISQSLREQITEYIKTNRLHFKKSQEYIADYYRNNDGSYLLIMKIRSSNQNYPTFEIKINTPSRQQAIEACKKWREEAHLVYEQVYETLLNFDED